MHKQTKYTRMKLDKALRSQRLVHFAIWGGVPVAVLILALGLYTPVDSAEVEATVKNSFIIVNEDSGLVHKLVATLNNGTDVKVFTVIMKPLKKGEQLTLLRRHSWFGLTSYTLRKEHNR